MSFFRFQTEVAFKHPPAADTVNFMKEPAPHGAHRFRLEFLPLFAGAAQINRPQRPYEPSGQVIGDEGRLKVDDAGGSLGVDDDVREASEVKVYDACAVHPTREGFKPPQKFRGNAPGIGRKERRSREKFGSERCGVKAKSVTRKIRDAFEAL